jgi:hypothetical protein
MAFDIISLVDANSGGLHALDMILLCMDIMQYYMQADGIPQFIVMMEDAQKKAKWAGMPIADVKLLMMAFVAVLAAQHFPREVDDWEGLPARSCTWQAWKVAFRLAHLRHQCQLQALGGGEPLGGAHTVISTAAPTMDCIKKALENLALAALNDTTVLQQLMAANLALTVLVTLLTAANKKLADDFVRSKGGATPAAALAPAKGHSANKPFLGNCCWTHGHRVSQTHTSATCSCKSMGHKDNATTASTMGGYEADKGWNSHARRCWSANLVHLDNINLCKNNYYYALLIESAPTPTSTSPHQHMGIANSGSSSFYFSCRTPVANYNPRAPTVSVTVANRCPKHSIASATLAFIPALFPSTMLGHVMPSFPHTLVGLGPFVNQGCKIVFDKTSVTIYHSDGHPILNGWQDINGPQIWQSPLTAPPPPPAHSPPLAPIAGGLSAAMSAGLPHPSQGFGATSTTREDIQVIFLREATPSMAMAHPALPTTCKRLTSPASAYLLASTMRVLVFRSSKRGKMPLKQAMVTPSMFSHTPMWQDVVPVPMKQSWDILPNSARMSDQPSPNSPPPCYPTALPTAASSPKDMPSNQVFIKVYPLRRLYTDDTGRFPIRACSGNQYIMIAFPSSSKSSSPKVTTIKLQPTMPLWHTWQQGVSRWTSKF